MSPAEKRQWQMRALRRVVDRLISDSEASYQRWLTTQPATMPAEPLREGDPSRSGWWAEHDHYDRDGYCDNPGRGY